MILLLCPIFASLARADERVHVHNKRNFPQAKLDNEINVPFLLNEHGDLFVSHNYNSVHLILFNLKKIPSDRKKIYGWKRAKNKDYTNALIYVHVV